MVYGTARKIRGLLAILIVCVMPAAALAQKKASVKVVTYFPHPNAAYDTVKLSPLRALPTCNSASEGVVAYLDDTVTKNSPYFCDGTEWRILGSQMIQIDHRAAATANDGAWLCCPAGQRILGAYGRITRYSSTNRTNLNFLYDPSEIGAPANPPASCGGAAAHANPSTRRAVYIVEGLVPGDGGEVEAWLTCLQK